MLSSGGLYRLCETIVRSEGRLGKETGKLLSVEQAAVYLGIGRGSAYEAARKGEIPTVKIGRRVLVPLAALERFLIDANQERPSSGRLIG
jgi:excisionase family DNA binding protein